MFKEVVSEADEEKNIKNNSTRKFS